MTWLELDCAEPDCRLENRYRKLSILIALPMFVLVAILAGVEYWLLRAHTLQSLAEKNAAVAQELETLIRRSGDHLRRMQTAYTDSSPAVNGELHRHFAASGPEGLYSLNSLPPALQDQTGQLLWRGGSADQGKMILAGFEAFSRLCRFDHATEPGFSHSYWLAANGDFFGVYPWQPSNEALAWSGFSINNQGSAALTGELLRKALADRNFNGQNFWLSPRPSGGPSATVLPAAPVLASAK